MLSPFKSVNGISALDKTREKKILFLSLEDVLDCGGADIIKASEDVQRGFELFMEDKVCQPFKTTLKARNADHEHSAGLVNFLPACVSLGEADIFACKALGAMPSNVQSGMPRATGLILLFDHITKSPLCVMDAQAISATRTGAVTMLALKKLANPETEETGLIGAGVNMRTQLLGIREALPKLKKARIYSRGESKYVFAREMGERTGLEIIPCEDGRSAVENCSLIVTCLPNMRTPVVMDEWVKQKGVTMVNIGCYESEISILKRMDRVIGDLWEQGKHRGIQTHAIAVAKGIIPESLLEDIGPVLTGRKPGRVSPDENIFFAPTGLGFEDAMLAWRIYNMAVDKKIGTSLTLWRSSRWI